MGLLEKAEEIINSKMILLDFEDEAICMVDAETVFYCRPHFFENMFFGWNVYAIVGGESVLIETYDTEEECKLLIVLIRAKVEMKNKILKIN